MVRHTHNSQTWGAMIFISQKIQQHRGGESGQKRVNTDVPPIGDGGGRMMRAGWGSHSTVLCQCALCGKSVPGCRWGDERGRIGGG